MLQAENFYSLNEEVAAAADAAAAGGEGKAGGSRESGQDVDVTDLSSSYLPSYAEEVKVNKTKTKSNVNFIKVSGIVQLRLEGE